MARDWFADAFGRAVADIRQKVVEEGWFGRVVTPRNHFDGHSDHTDRSITEVLGWSSSSVVEQNWFARVTTPLDGGDHPPREADRSSATLLGWNVPGASSTHHQDPDDGHDHSVDR
jgi:hypothetical protein